MCSAIFLFCIVSDSFGKLNDKYRDGSTCVGGVSAVALGAAALPEPLVSKGVAVAAGAFQVGWFATGFIWNLFDPSDTINYCVPVTMNVIQYPDILTQAPLCDPVLAVYLNQCLDHADTLVALSRAILQANDRYQGALFKQDISCALARRNELNNFIAMFNDLRPRLRNCWNPVFARIMQINPLYLNTPITKSVMIQMRDSTAAGNFPPVELISMSLWSITPQESSILSSFMGGLSNSMIDNFYDNYSPGATSIPLQYCLEEALDCTVDFEITPVTSTLIYNYAEQSSGTTNALYSVSSVSESVGWTAGANATVLRTTNAGTTWLSATGTGLSGHVYNIWGISTTTAFCTTTPSTTNIYKTTDGGATWTTVFSQSGGFIDAIQMISPTTGYAVGDPVGGKWTVLKTTDSGNTWNRIATEPVQSGSEAGWNNSFQIDGNYMWFGTSSGTVYHSTDLGVTWSSSATPGSTNNYALHFNSKKNGLAGGNGMTRSNDSSETYSSVNKPPTLTDIYGMDGFVNEWWAVGSGPEIYKTGDGGLNWNIVFFPRPLIFYYAINLFKNNNAASGWIVGSQGEIVRMNSMNLNSTLDLTLFIEGLFTPGPNTQIGDTVTVYLANSVSPYNFVDSVKAYSNSIGNSVMDFVNAPGGNYYIVVRHRNALETWGAGPVSMLPSTISFYNFTTASSQAYGNNMKQKGIKWCLYSGDVVKDGSVDLTDIIIIFNDATNFVSGYIPSDLNGDGFADLTDITIAFNNAANFVSLIRP